LSTVFRQRWVEEERPPLHEEIELSRTLVAKRLDSSIEPAFPDKAPCGVEQESLDSLYRYMRSIEFGRMGVFLTSGKVRGCRLHVQGHMTSDTTSITTFLAAIVTRMLGKYRTKSLFLVSSS
jgi:hypothetical protein